jgi:hypothetical protein
MHAGGVVAWGMGLGNPLNGCGREAELRSALCLRVVGLGGRAPSRGLGTPPAPARTERLRSCATVLAARASGASPQRPSEREAGAAGPSGAGAAPAGGRSRAGFAGGTAHGTATGAGAGGGGTADRATTGGGARVTTVGGRTGAGGATTSGGGLGGRGKGGLSSWGGLAEEARQGPRAVLGAEEVGGAGGCGCTALCAQCLGVGPRAGQLGWGVAALAVRPAQHAARLPQPCASSPTCACACPSTAAVLALQEARASRLVALYTAACARHGSHVDASVSAALHDSFETQPVSTTAGPPSPAHSGRCAPARSSMPGP